MCKMHKKILEILFIIEEMHIERRKNGKECYPKSKLRTAKKRVCNKKHRCFCKKLLFFEILVRPLDK